MRRTAGMPRCGRMERAQNKDSHRVVLDSNAALSAETNRRPARSSRSASPRNCAGRRGRIRSQSVCLPRGNPRSVSGASARSAGEMD